jgi:hypothetical protein
MPDMRTVFTDYAWDLELVRSVREPAIVTPGAGRARRALDRRRDALP